MRNKKLTDAEFLKLIVDKELEIVGAPIRYDDITEDYKLPDSERKLDNWFQDYSFKTPEQYFEWKTFVYDQFKNWSHVRYSKKWMDEWFSWNTLQYGLSFDFDYSELKEFKNNNNKK